MFKTTIDCIHAKFPNNKGIITIQNDSANRIYKREVAIEQKNEKYRNRFALSDDPALDFTLVTSNGKFGGGFDTSLALDTFRLKTYDATIYYAHQDYHLALKHISKNPISYALGDLIFSLYYNFKPNFKLGASVTYTSEKTVDITVGSSYELNPDISIKTRGDSEGALALSIRTKISPYVSLLTASQFNVRSLSHNHNPKMEFSFRINLNQ